MKGRYKHEGPGDGVALAALLCFVALAVLGLFHFIRWLL